MASGERALFLHDGESCGDAGGRTKTGEPCSRPAGWGRVAGGGKCVDHDGSRRPPSHLSADSAELWREVTDAYVFAVEGYPVLETALTALDRARQARQEIEKAGLLFVNEATGTPHSNPMLRVERDAQKEFRLAWKQLDLNISPEDG